jgi:hypothetical protein
VPHDDEFSGDGSNRTQRERDGGKGEREGPELTRADRSGYQYAEQEVSQAREELIGKTPTEPADHSQGARSKWNG